MYPVSGDQERFEPRGDGDIHGVRDTRYLLYFLKDRYHWTSFFEMNDMPLRYAPICAICKGENRDVFAVSE